MSVIRTKLPKNMRYHRLQVQIRVVEALIWEKIEVQDFIEEIYLNKERDDFLNDDLDELRELEQELLEDQTE